MTTVVSQAPPPPRRRLRLPRFLLAVPGFVWYVFFYAIPVLYVVWYSFGYKPGVNEKGGVRTDRLSFDNYRDIWTDDFRQVFWSTLRIAGTGTLACVLIGVPVAYFMAIKAGPKLRSLMLLLVIVPFWMSFFIRTSAWRIVLAPNGFLSNLLIDWGIRDTKIAFLDTRAAVILAVVYNYLPLMILPAFVSLERIDSAMREASKDLGAGRVKTFFSVTLPLAAPGIAAGAMLVFIPLVGDYVTATILGGAKGNMIGNVIASFAIVAQDLPKGAAAAVVLILLIIGVVALAMILSWVIRKLLARNRAVFVGGVE
jgi:spermidine/putrescine transport system permease protein